MASRGAQGTKLTTNSGTCPTLTTLSFSLPWRSLAPVKSRVGGLAQTSWKNENCARLVLPEVEMVETHAMGRGLMALISHG